jgi:hypothetical protein
MQADFPIESASLLRSWLAQAAPSAGKTLSPLAGDASTRRYFRLHGGIGAVLIIVVVLMAGFSVLSHKLGWDEALNMTFFPMVILAWTIERMSITWEEQGPREVLVQGGGSLLVAILAFLVMDQPQIRHLAFNFPELNLCVLALILYLGRYTGYRLLELHRFAVFNR